MSNYGSVTRKKSLWFLTNALERMRKIGQGGTALDIKNLISVSTELALPSFCFLHAPMLRAEYRLNGHGRGTSSCVVRADNKPKCVIHVSGITVLNGTQEYLIRKQQARRAAS